MVDKNTLLRIEPEIKKLENDLRSLTKIAQYTCAEIETMAESCDDTFMPDIYELYNKGEKHLYRIITQMNVFYNAVDLNDPSQNRQQDYDSRIHIGSDHICIRVPMFSSRNRTILRPNYPYEDALRQALAKHSFPHFDKTAEAQMLRSFATYYFSLSSHPKTATSSLDCRARSSDLANEICPFSQPLHGLISKLDGLISKLALLPQVYINASGGSRLYLFRRLLTCLFILDHRAFELGYCSLPKAGIGHKGIVSGCFV